MRKVYILFGEMGCGKSYRGLRFARNIDGRFFEGDDVIPPDMKKRTSKFKMVSRTMLDEYMLNLFEAILAEAKTLNDGEGLVVAQALYRDDDRKNLMTALLQEDWGLNVEMVWVRTPWKQNIKNLLTRAHGFKWVTYWLLNKPFFQKPSHDYAVLKNDNVLVEPFCTRVVFK